MFADISWGEFLFYTASFLAIYGVGVLFKFYRGSFKRSAASEIVGSTAEDELKSASSSGVMGKTREQKTRATAVALACEACGHVAGQAVLRSAVDSYGVPISTPTAQFPAPTLAPPAMLVNEFEPVDGEVDVASVLSALERVSSSTRLSVIGDTNEANVAQKSEALSLFANEDLLNSEVASQLAMQLDRSVPTEGYSAVETLSNLKAA